MGETPETTDQTKIPLNRAIGLTTAILLVAGNIIGTGVFKKIVPMAQTGLSEWPIMSAWILAGVIALLGAFTMAGLSKLTTVSGGMYEYMRLCFGKLPAFFLGWTGFTIICSGAAAAIAFIFAQSVNSIIPLPNPLGHFKTIAIGNFIFPFADSGIKILAIASITLLTWLNYHGVKKGTILNNIVTGTKILGILLLIVLGLLFFGGAQSGSTMDLVIPKNSGTISIFFGTMLSAFWAYDGFANVGYVTGEIKDPKRNVAIAIITGVSMVIVLYLLVNYAYVKTLGLKEIAGLGENSIAATAMASRIFGNRGKSLISFLIMLSSLGTLNVVIIFHARLYFRMAQENAFFKNAAKVHPVYRTPYIALIYSMIWSVILVVSGTFDKLTDIVIFSGFLFYAALAAGLIKMKRKGFIKEKVPGYPWAPVIFILFSIVLLISTFINQPKLSFIGLGLMLTGIPFYYFFKRKN